MRRFKDETLMSYSKRILDNYILNNGNVSEEDLYCIKKIVIYSEDLTKYKPSYKAQIIGHIESIFNIHGIKKESEKIDIAKAVRLLLEKLSHDYYTKALDANTYSTWTFLSNLGFYLTREYDCKFDFFMPAAAHVGLKEGVIYYLDDSSESYDLKAVEHPNNQFFNKKELKDMSMYVSDDDCVTFNEDNKEVKHDMVNSPSHYTDLGNLYVKEADGLYRKAEVFDVINSLTKGLNGGKAVGIGNAIKYLGRFDKKAPDKSYQSSQKDKDIEDLNKAKRYIDMVINLIKNE